MKGSIKDCSKDRSKESKEGRTSAALHGGFQLLLSVARQGLDNLLTFNFHQHGLLIAIATQQLGQKKHTEGQLKPDVIGVLVRPVATS